MTNPKLRMDQYAFQRSVGMRQRAMITFASVMRPTLLISAIPPFAPDAPQNRVQLTGDIPSPVNPPSG
ncbi:MAG: hypothetical protein ACFE0J_09020 [Elainellaceae cyanobacterium]